MFRKFTRYFESSTQTQTRSARISRRLVDKAIVGGCALGWAIPLFFLLFCLLTGCSSASTEPTTDPDKAHSTYASLKVRLADSDDKTWQDAITVHPGDELELQMEYRNYYHSSMSHIVVRYELSDELSLADQTAYMYNEAYPDGLPYEAAGAISGGGLDIGNYIGADPENGEYRANAYVRIAVIVGEDVKPGTILAPTVYVSAYNNGSYEHLTGVELRLNVE